MPKFVIMEVYEYEAPTRADAEGAARQITERYEGPTLFAVADSVGELPHPELIPGAQGFFVGKDS